MTAGTTTAPLTVECDVHFRQRYRGRKEMQVGVDSRPAVPLGRIPRVARLMALAMRFDGLVRSGAVRDYADLARLGHVSRARVSQVMSLLNLSPSIQEDILFMPLVLEGRDPLVLRDVLPITRYVRFVYRQQRRLCRWRVLLIINSRHAGHHRTNHSSRARLVDSAWPRRPRPGRLRLAAEVARNMAPDSAAPGRGKAGGFLFPRCIATYLSIRPTNDLSRQVPPLQQSIPRFIPAGTPARFGP
jgi:hypothetical protein